ncbi:MAG TPA: hypothetical protein P5246_01740, partial [Candidatus Omnitrophota bacterium]|nr:hypothetical protein [Candidatus Omnitrophota bacterium]
RSAGELFNANVSRVFSDIYSGKADLWGPTALGHFGITADTTLTQVLETPYKHSFDKTGKAIFTQVEDKDAIVHHYLLPGDPLGRSIATGMPNGDFVVLEWWLERTEGMKAPVGILPGSFSVHENGSKGENKRFAGEVASVAFRDGKEVVEPAFYYRIDNSQQKRGEAYSQRTGQLVSRDFDLVALRLANVRPVTMGTETTYYDLGVVYEKPVEARDENGKTTKKWISVEVKENGEREHLIREKRPLAPWTSVTAKYNYDQYGNFISKQELVMQDFVDELKNSNMPYYLLGILAVLALGFIALGNWGRRKLAKSKHEADAKRAEDVTKTPVDTKERPAVPFNKDENEVRKEIENCLVRLGLTGKDYTALVDRLTKRIMLCQGVSLEEVYKEDAKAFNEWHGRVGKSSGAYATTLGDDLLVTVLAEVVFETTLELKEQAVSLRYYLFDRALAKIETDRAMGISRKESLKSVVKDLQTFVAKLLTILKVGYAHIFDKKDEQTVATILSCDDIRDAFDGYKETKGRSIKGKTLDELIAYIETDPLKGQPAGTPQIKREWRKAHLPAAVEFKGFADKEGAFAYLKAIHLVWTPLMISFAGVTVASLVQLFGLAAGGWIWAILGVSVLATLANMYFGKLNLLKIDAAFVDAFGENAARVAKEQILKTWVVFTISIIVWTLLNKTILLWTLMLVGQMWALGAGWFVLLAFVTVGLAAAFMILSIWPIMYTLMSIFGFFQGQVEGVGQVRSIQDVIAKYSKAREQFMKVYIPEGNDTMPPKEAWDLVWETFINELEKEFKADSDVAVQLRALRGKAKLTDSDEKQFEAALKALVKNPEASDRITLFINAWLMDMPAALRWEMLPSLTAFITAFDENISFELSDNFAEHKILGLNFAENEAKTTRLNKLLTIYKEEWGRFVAELISGNIVIKKGGMDVHVMLSIAEIDEIREHTEAVANGETLRKIKISVLSENVRLAMMTWANLRWVGVERTIRDVAKIRDAFKVYARICAPRITDNAQIEQMVDEKLQILLCYEGYCFAQDNPDDKKSPRNNRENLHRLMAEFPFMEVWWRGFDPDTAKGEQRQIWHDEGVRKGSPTNIISRATKDQWKGGVKKGKTIGQAACVPYIRNEKVLFFDANAAMRIEDVMRLINGLSEFKQDPLLKLVLFGEYICLSPDYSWVAEGVSFGEEVWVTVTQRTLNMFGASGYYGHSAIMDMEALRVSAGMMHDYVSEDLMLAVMSWIKGYHTTHKEYLLLGKGRETGFHSALVPMGKWSQGSGEMILGRWVGRTLASEKVHIGQKMMLIFALSHYTKKPFVPVVLFLYLGWVIFLGVSGFAGFAWPIIFGVLGLFLNQAINTQGVVYLFERMGLAKAITKFFGMFPKLYVLFTALIPTYAFDLMSKGFKNLAVFPISPKGWNLGHLGFIEGIWGKGSLKPLAWQVAFTGIGLVLFILGTAVTALPLLLQTVLQYAGIIVLIASTILYFIPGVREKMWKEKFIWVSGLRIQLVMSIPMMAWVILAMHLWGSALGAILFIAGAIFAVLAYKALMNGNWKRGIISGSISVLAFAGMIAFCIALPHTILLSVVWLALLGTIIGWGIASFKRSYKAAVGTLVLGLGIMFLASWYFNPIFMLFAFSFFYMGMPFSWFFTPIVGHEKGWSSFTEVVNTFMEEFGIMRKSVLAIAVETFLRNNESVVRMFQKNEVSVNLRVVAPHLEQALLDMNGQDRAKA